jgi:hypothetical protein
MLIKDAIVKDANIAESAEFNGWIERYGDYIL